MDFTRPRSEHGRVDVLQEGLRGLVLRRQLLHVRGDLVGREGLDVGVRDVDHVREVVSRLEGGDLVHVGGGDRLEVDRDPRILGVVLVDHDLIEVGVEAGRDEAQRDRLLRRRGRAPLLTGGTRRQRGRRAGPGAGQQQPAPRDRPRPGLCAPSPVLPLPPLRPLCHESVSPNGHHRRAPSRCGLV